ncbi:MAG: hypothetical protein HY913_00030 [Desulfomonile tiedjei]|nr:hypothetical protein [Desulfomonile tiedjei]
MGAVPGKTGSREIQAQAVEQAVRNLKFLHAPGAVFEICIIGPKVTTSALWECRAFGKKPIVAGWFRDPQKAAQLAMEIRAEGIYTTLNPCREALLGRAHERLKANADRTADKDIARLCNFLIDIDPQRPAGISSSDAEHQAALAMAREIKAGLAKEGWPEPLLGDSGNGGHLIYPLDLEHIPEHVELLKAALGGLADRYGPRLTIAGLDIDRTVFNAARLVKLYGTVAAKGDNLPERPHRRAQILERPEHRTPVPRELLQKLADEAPLPPVQSGARAGTADPSGPRQGRFDVSAYLAKYGRGVVKIKNHGGATLYCLEECIFDPSHQGNEAAIGQGADGKLFYHCFHNSCKEKDFHQARVIISGSDNLGQFVVGGRAPDKRRKKNPTQASANNGGGASGLPVTQGLSWSDFGNAQRLVALHGQDLRYNHLNKEWYHWTGRRWQVDDSGEAVRRAKATIQTIYQEASAEDEKKRHDDLFKFALKSEGVARVKAMLDLAQSEPGIPILPKDLDVNPWLFNCQNGTIDLRLGHLQPHRREDLITCLSPVVYDSKAECPGFEKFLYQIMGNNQNLVDFLWLSLGYALTGDTGEQCFWIFWGSGANGKGTLVNCISDLFGSYWMNIATETLLARENPGNQIRSDVARLDGPRLVTAAEIDKGRRLSESLIKGVTGKDTITARFLYGKDFDFVPQFKLFIQTNNKPVIRDQTNAMWRRIKLVEFPMDFRDHPDRDLPEKLAAESSGILAWLVRGCLNWQQYGDLAEPPEVIEATQEYRMEMDPLKEFLEERCVRGAGLMATAGELYLAYSGWAKENDLNAKEKLSKRNFGLTLAEQGFRRKKGTGGRRCYLGLGLRSVA